MSDAYTRTDARFSPCGQYRYTLERWWSGLYRANNGYCNFLMLNPSTADAAIDDPTVRRAGLFAKRCGYAGLIVTNLFAYRATDPRELHVQLCNGEYSPSDPIGPENDETIQKVAARAALVVCAWGIHGGLLDRGQKVAAMLTASEIPLYCLGVTKAGYPKHPLYLCSDVRPVPYAMP